MLSAVAEFHRRHDFKGRGGEDMVYRIALMAEELGELSACVSKGLPQSELAEECADLLILVLGNAISVDFDLKAAFWRKIKTLEERQERMINGRIRVSSFNDAT